MSIELSTQTASQPIAAKRKRGFTLTEIAIVLGIIGLILGAIWGAASAVYSNKKVADSEQGITATAAAVRALFASANGNTGLTAAATMTTPGMFPVSWNGTTSGYNSPFNNAVTALGTAYVIGNGTTFGIELDGVTAAGCAALLNYFSSAASGTNGGQVTGLISTSNTTGTPVAGTPKSGTAIAALATYAAGTTCVTTAAPGFAGANSVVIGFDMAKM